MASGGNGGDKGIVSLREVVAEVLIASQIGSLKINLSDYINSEIKKLLFFLMQ